MARARSSDGGGNTPSARPSSAPSGPVADATALRDALLRWFDGAKRPLPWRETADPYAVWISEIMCQQTRVDTAAPYFRRWMARFPDVAALAAASEEEVFELWQGLGYYSRARNLRRAAADIHARGGFPNTADELATLPGIGRYSAGAIASIAFRQPTPAVDGNVARVLSRVLAHGATMPSGGDATIWDAAASVATGTRPGDVNQALMELGATVCKPRAPICRDCPLADRCAAHAAGDPEAYPVRPPRTAPRPETRIAFALRRSDGATLMARRSGGGLLSGLWQYPMSPPVDPNDGAGAVAAALFGQPLPGLGEAGVVEHTFSHIQMRVVAMVAEVGDASEWTPAGYDETRWVRPGELPPRSRLVAKLAEVVLG
ncbi:MAG: A/G-specific adenine glycosylase [Myxococcales bacterium]|nr:A/G-specific adenine glycosylase [Myxococcales bacterium]